MQVREQLKKWQGPHTLKSGSLDCPLPGLARPLLWGMDYRIMLRAVPSRPGVVPATLADLTSTSFTSIEEARESAWAMATSPEIGPVHSVLIETDDGKNSEHWVRHGDSWRREVAPPT